MCKMRKTYECANESGKRNKKERKTKKRKNKIKIRITEIDWRSFILFICLLFFFCQFHFVFLSNLFDWYWNHLTLQNQSPINFGKDVLVYQNQKKEKNHFQFIDLNGKIFGSDNVRRCRKLHRRCNLNTLFSSYNTVNKNLNLWWREAWNKLCKQSNGIFHHPLQVYAQLKWIDDWNSIYDQFQFLNPIK